MTEATDLQATYQVGARKGRSVTMTGHPDDLDEIVNTMQTFIPPPLPMIDIPIDTTAFLQGVVDARDCNSISNDMADLISKRVIDLSHEGPTGRQIIKHSTLMMILANISPSHWTELFALWKFLGESIQSGIIVQSGIIMAN